MPINVEDGLPAIAQLEKENIFLMKQSRAIHQDIRPLKIAILNLMPEKAKTELHLLRRLSNTPIQLEVDLFHPQTHECKNTPREHLDDFYKTFDQVRKEKYDGLIITGAPVEKLEFEQVDYWKELKEIMEWSKHHVNSVLYICWAAQAGLYYHYGIGKHTLDSKQFGVFKHKVNDTHCHLTKGFDDIFWAPHSTHSSTKREDIIKNKNVRIISESDDAGAYIIISNDNKHVFVTGHSEYDPLTLFEEYERDKKKGKEIQIPQNYFPDNDPAQQPRVRWRSHSNLLFTNWLNYYVYQVTPFDINKVQ